MRTKNKCKSVEAAKRMPELLHKAPGESFDIMASDVANWLCNQPEIRQAVFDHYNHREAIIYDKEKGTWKGNSNGESNGGI